MANMPQNDQVAAEKAARNPKCARCRNHGLVVPLKGHSGKCQFRPCVCWKCSLIAERTKILASQRRIKTGNVKESPSDDRPKPSRSVGKTVAAAVNETTTGGNCESHTNARQESIIKTPVQRADIDGKTYTELQAPVTGPVSATAGYCELTLKAPTGLSTPGDPPHIPGEYIITEAIPRHIYSGEMFAMPLYPHYPDRYMCPALLVTLRPPAPGTFREPFGFLPAPPAAQSHLLETPESQFHMPCYSPCPTYPVLRDENGPRPHHHMDREQGIHKSPPEQAKQSHVCCNQEPEFVPADGLSSKNTA